MCVWCVLCRYGVTCNEQGAVTELDLRQKDINGTLPVQLSALTALSMLDLAGMGAGGLFPFSSV